ncbi:hypothetical protein [Neobacillus sp. NPDC093127]
MEAVWMQVIPQLLLFNMVVQVPKVYGKNGDNGEKKWGFFND